MNIIRAKRHASHIELTPLVDVVFQLLVFFMLASTFTKPTINMTLPKALTKDEASLEKVIVSVQYDGQILLNNDQIIFDYLAKEASLLMNQLDTTTVHLHGDQQITYQRFVEVMDVLRQAGASQINLVHETGS